jgi:hypothetical protein
MHAHARTHARAHNHTIAHLRPQVHDVVLALAQLLPGLEDALVVDVELELEAAPAGDQREPLPSLEAGRRGAAPKKSKI